MGWTGRVLRLLWLRCDIGRFGGDFFEEFQVEE